MPKPSKRVRQIVGSPIRRIAVLLERAAANRDIISFGGGAPSIKPPSEIINHLIKHLKKEPHQTTGYSSTVGIPSLLEKISEDLRFTEKIHVNPKKEIALTDGGTEGLFMAINATVDPKDEVIISDPTYAAYKPTIEYLGARAVPVHTSWREDYQMSPEKVNEKVNRKTKAIILLSPDNPTGRVQEKKNVRGIVEIAKDHNLWLITDDVYKHIIFGEKFTNSRKFGGYENTLTCCSFSKSFSVPGFRLGYAYGPREVVERIEKLKQYTSLCPSRPAQIMIEKGLENKAKIRKKYVRKNVIPTYKKRRDLMAKLIKKTIPEAGTSMPKGAFYFFVDMENYLDKMDGEQFSDKLLKKENLVLIPGKFFGKSGRNHLRFTFVSEPEPRIREGFERLADFLEG
jgi:aspartate aminotransferase